MKLIRNLLLLLACSLQFARAQVLIVNYQLKAGNSLLQLGDSFLANGKWYRLDVCKFYSGAAPISVGKKPKFTWRLVDFSKPESLIQGFNFSRKTEKIFIGWGVDSITQETSKFNGDLDPLHGMYWTWQSGYIQLKLECTELSGESHEKNGIQLHIGGFTLPFKSNFMEVMDFRRQSKSGNDSLQIVLDVAGFLSGIFEARMEDAKASNKVLTSADLQNIKIMSPSKWSNIAVEIWQKNTVVKWRQ